MKNTVLNSGHGSCLLLRLEFRSASRYSNVRPCDLLLRRRLRRSLRDAGLRWRRHDRGCDGNDRLAVSCRYWRSSCLCAYSASVPLAFLKPGWGEGWGGWLGGWERDRIEVCRPYFESSVSGCIDATLSEKGLFFSMIRYLQDD